MSFKKYVQLRESAAIDRMGNLVAPWQDQGRRDFSRRRLNTYPDTDIYAKATAQIEEAEAILDDPEATNQQLVMLNVAIERMMRIVQNHDSATQGIAANPNNGTLSILQRLHNRLQQRLDM